MICWRYRTIVFEFKKDGLFGDRFIDDEEVEKTMNEHGRAGWELVNATMIQDGLLTVFKQPDSGEVICKSEEEKNELSRIGDEIEILQMSNENSALGRSRQRESDPVSHAKPAQTLKKQFDCLAGKIKIN